MATLPFVPRRAPKRRTNAYDASRLDPEEVAEFKRLLGEQLDSLAGYGGAKITGVLTEFNVFDAHKALIQNEGAANGCHSCGTKIATDPTQNFVSDHQPPVALHPSVRAALGVHWDGYRLFPQCDVCAAQQAALVNRLNSTHDITTLTADERKLVFCNQPTGFVVTTNFGKPTEAERVAVQLFGRANGCHSCPTDATRRYPNRIYHADHIYPQEMATSYFQELCTLLDIDYPEEMEFRPQCKRCSTTQGAKWTQISDKAKKLARAAGITVY